jgi:hypothetical protein
MINRSEISSSINFDKPNVVGGIFSERDNRLLFIKSFINENFGDGKFYSKLKTYGLGCFSTCETED